MSPKKASSYVSKPVDAKGYAEYTDEENSIWQALISRQIPLIKDRACSEYMNGIDLLNMSMDRIPQCPEINEVLQDCTGWSLAPVAALIPFDEFFCLLANRQFPAATFIRTRRELDYLQEPDIFHEVFGHCPLLTNQAYADFAHTYGKLGLEATHQDRVMLAKLYWFTIEFGLLNTASGLRIYGGGILSSMEETVYSLESDIPQRKPLDVIDVLRTPYRIDIKQPVYFVINSFDDLFKLTEMDLIGMIKQAREMGMHKPLYETAS